MSKHVNKPYTQDPYFKRWMAGLSERTKQNYTERIQNWITFIDMDLTKQVTKRMNNLTSQDLSERQYFEDKFRAYKEYLEKRGDLKPLSVRTELTAVASFFSRIGLPLNLKRGDWESTQQQSIIQRLKISRDDIKAMYSHANLRDRALLLVLAQSGFSEVDVSFFRIEELKGFYENPETEHYFVEKPREKTNEVQATCLSYEAVHDLQAMLQERGNPQSGYLFVSQTKGKGEQLEVRSINEAMKALAQKTFSQDKAKEFKTKALRSFYNSALLRAAVSPQELKDLMFGHGRKGARGHYDYDETTIKEAYAKTFEHLSINGLHTQTDIRKVMDALKAVQDTNIIFNRQLDEKGKEIDELKKSVKKIDEFTDFLNSLEPEDAASWVEYRLRHKQPLDVPEVAYQIPSTPTFEKKLDELMKYKAKHNIDKITLKELIDLSNEAAKEDEQTQKDQKTH